MGCTVEVDAQAAVSCKTGPEGIWSTGAPVISTTREFKCYLLYRLI